MPKVRVEFLQTCVTQEGKFHVGDEAMIDEAEYKRLGDSICRLLPDQGELEPEQDPKTENGATAEADITPENKAGKPGKKK